MKNYQKSSASNEFDINNTLNSFIQLKNETSRPISTGFDTLDCVLDGGLYKGLYTIGAISSLGKTTLVLQIADQIAKNGQDVLIFSLEMSATELIAKSISRETYLFCKSNNINFSRAKTARDIINYNYNDNSNSEDAKVVNEAMNIYSDYLQNIFIKDGFGDISVKNIRRTVEEFKSIRNKVPVIIVDYLQIIAPYNIYISDKQNIDKTILELKRISRDFETPLLAISSFNRDNYASGATMSAFKESGAIEYSSDVLIGLQPQGVENDFETNQKNKNKKIIEEYQRQTIKSIEMVILKNRYGKVGDKVGFLYHAPFNCYIEQKSTEESKTKKVGDKYRPFSR